MSSLPEFTQLLGQLQNVDNDVRSRAEATYDAMDSANCLNLLLQAMDDKSAAIDVRIFAAILCRRWFMNKFKVFSELPENTREAVKNQLLVTILNETDQSMRKKICEVACELAINSEGADGNNTWSELVDFMVKCSQSEDPGLRVIGYYILSSVPTIFGSQTNNHLKLIHDMIAHSFNDQFPSKVREASVQALTAFLVNHAEEDSIYEPLKPLAVRVIQSIAIMIQSEPDNEEMLKSLVEIAESAPKFIRPEIKATLEMCYQILTNEELADSIRHLALEVIITMSESKPAAVRKIVGHIIEPLVGTLLTMMTDLDDDPDWDSQDTAEDEDEGFNAVTAELALDRFACALGGQNVLLQITNKVPHMLNSENWKQRQAGLIAVSACAEGCQKQMESMLGSIVDAVIPKLNDPHPRVRHAACNAIGQMAVDFGPKLQKSHHETVIPALMHVLDDPCARVQAMSAAAIVNFCEKTPRATLRQYLEPMIGKLEQVMSAKFQEMVEHGKRLVLEQIVTTVASVADASGDDFAPYYDRFMPLLKFIMEQATHPDLRMLRGKTIECISLIGLAVGRDKFTQDAAPIMNLLLSTHATTDGSNNNTSNTGVVGSSLDADDPQISYMIGAWARICKLMGAEFKPYLPMVMPQVLHTASIRPDVCLVDNDQAEAVDDDNWEVVKLNQTQNFAIRTSGLEDKSTACRMLLCYARELKESFAPYCEQVLEIMLPTLKFYFNDEVRDAAAEIMPYLLDSVKLSNPSSVPHVWNKICAALLEAIGNEPDRELVADQLEALAGCIEVLGPMACNADGSPNVLTSQQLTDIHHLMDHKFHEHFEKDDERMAQRRDEDYDEVEEERLLNEKDDDEFVLSKIYDVMRAIFVTHKENAISFFKLLMPHCVRLLKPDRPASDLKWGLCFWSDIVEFAKGHAWELRDYYLPVLAASLQHHDPEVRQNALSAFHMVALHGSEEFTPTLTEVAPIIVKIIELPDSRSDDNNRCTENAISALTRIMKVRPHCMQSIGCSMEEFLAKWVTWLPVWEDDMETEFVYNQLCDLVDMNNPQVLGPDNANLPHIVSSIAQAMATEGLTPKTGLEDNFGNPIALAEGCKSVWERCVSLLRQIQSNGAMFDACVSQLDEEQKKALATALQVR